MLHSHAPSGSSFVVEGPFGHRDLAKLVIAIERHALLIAAKDQVRQEITDPVTV